MYIYAQKNNEEFIFDNNGKNIEDSEYTSKYQIDNTEYKITINKNNKYGVINNKDEVIIPNIYNYIGYLTNNYFVVSTENGKNGIVNDKGEIILEKKYDTIQKLDNCDLIEVNIIDTNTVSLYNKNIEKKLQMNNATIKEYSEYVKIYSKDELKYINFNGEEKSSKEILPDNNLYIDVKNGKWGFIDKQGNVIVDYLYDEVTEFNQYGFAGIKKDEKWGSIDKTGKIIIEPKYKINISSNEIDFIGQYYRIIYGYKKFYYTNNVNE